MWGRGVKTLSLLGVPMPRHANAEMTPLNCRSSLASPLHSWSFLRLTRRSVSFNSRHRMNLSKKMRIEIINHISKSPCRVLQRIRPSQRPCVIFRTMLFFCGKKLLAPAVVSHFLFNICTAALCLSAVSSIRNLRLRLAGVTRDMMGGYGLDSVGSGKGQLWDLVKLRAP
jgi:hypothetical protein